MHRKNSRLTALIVLALHTSLAAQTERDLSQIKSGATFMQLDTRPKWQLDTVYPYQLTLFTIDSLAQESAKVLPKLDKPVILAFWMTTCYPCRIELDAYTRHYAQWKQEADFELVAISLDFAPRFQQIGQIARSQKYPFPVYWDMNREFTQLMPGGLNGLPQVFVLDKNGNIAYHKRKYSSGDEVKLFDVIKSLQ